MSLFRTTELPCPSCGKPVSFEAVHSVNADRRPDLRDAIVEGSFQRETCASCGTEFRLDPEFTYMDLGRNLWIAVYPLDQLENWREVEESVSKTFDLAFGSGAPQAARDLGVNLKPRVVFGWPALWEKIAANQHGLDDVQVAMLEIALLKNAPDSPLGEDTELRLLDAPDDGKNELSFAWLDSNTADFLQGMRVPRELYADIGAEPESWRALRSSLSEGAFVDMKRLITAGV
jgi:hypothetical protein